LGAFGSTPNSGGASISGSTITIQPADASNPGALSTAAQTIVGAKTLTGALLVSASGAASVPGLWLSGTPYAAGSATTNKALWFMEWGAPTSTAWNPNGTAIGVNAAAAFTGKLLDLKLNNNTVMSVDYGSGSSANQGSGVFIRNVNDNSNGGLVLAGQTGAVGSSANVVCFYQSNAATFSLYSLAAAQGAYKLFNTNNTYATFAIGGATAAAGYTYQTIIQLQAAAAYNAAVTLAVRASATQTGDLQRWESNSPATLAKVDINGKGFFTGLANTAFAAAGVVTNDASGNLASVAPGTSGNVLTSNGSAWVSSAAAGGGMTKAINQTTHGFAVGDVPYYTGSAYAKAKSDADSTSEALGVVSVVTDANNFTLTMGGYVSGLSGLTAGTTYYLSDATAGLLTATQPTTVGHISKPVLVADSTTSGYVIQSRGVTIASTSNGSNYAWSGTLDSGSSWSTTSASFADLGSGSSTSVAAIVNSNFATTPTALASSAPGLSVTFPSAGVYEITVKLAASNSSSANSNALRLIDGSSTVIDTGFISTTSNTPTPITLSGLYTASAVATTLKVQGKCSSGTLSTAQGYVAVMAWTIKKVGN
jgi:hypothetical protein